MCTVAFCSFIQVCTFTAPVFSLCAILLVHVKSNRWILYNFWSKLDLSVSAWVSLGIIVSVQRLHDMELHLGLECTAQATGILGASQMPVWALPDFCTPSSVAGSGQVIMQTKLHWKEVKAVHCTAVNGTVMKTHVQFFFSFATLCRLFKLEKKGKNPVFEPRVPVSNEPVILVHFPSFNL